MASPSSASNPTHNSTNNNNPSSGYAAFEPNTTFVQANPSNFKSIVQKLTGLSPPTPRFAGKSNFGEMGPRGTPFKLHERRQTSRKLEINLADGNGIGSGSGINQMGFLGFGSGGSGVGEMVSPVSPLEIFGKVSPQSPYCDSEQEAKNKKDEEMKEISEKGFYLHPNPFKIRRGGNTGGSFQRPQLLPLFPMCSPRSRDDVVAAAAAAAVANANADDNCSSNLSFNLI